MKTIQYIFNCFFSQPSPYQIRRHSAYRELYEIQYNGKAIHEGTYDDCQTYLSGKQIAVSPSLYQ